MQRTRNQRKKKHLIQKEVLDDRKVSFFTLYLAMKNSSALLHCFLLFFFFLISENFQGCLGLNRSVSIEMERASNREHHCQSKPGYKYTSLKHLSVSFAVGKYFLWTKKLLVQISEGSRCEWWHTFQFQHLFEGVFANIFYWCLASSQRKHLAHGI